MAGFREFLTGEVLTAANVNDFLMKQSVMVFADDAARDSALGTAIGSGNALLEGMLVYNADVPALQVYDGTSWTGVAPVAKEKRIAAFTGSGTWTVPAGVTYAIAHMMGGGGGFGRLATAGDGGASSVAFASGTVTANGLSKAVGNNQIYSSFSPGAANLGQSGAGSFDAFGTEMAPPTNVFLTAAASVTPAASITVTVGAGGAAGTNGAAGGSGYVYIEYYEEV